MTDLIYDVFVKGVIPLAIIGVLGYAAKAFLSLEGSVKWRIIGFAIVVTVLLAGLYGQYLLTFSNYRTHFIPETSNIIGSTTRTDSSRSYWEIDKDTLISLPILVKDNRLISLYVEVDSAPVSVEYFAEQGALKIVLENEVSPLFERKETEELLGKNTYISGSISKNKERILTVKARVNKNLKIYSYSIERAYPTLQAWGFFVILSLIWLLPAVLVIKGFRGWFTHNKKG